MQYYVYALRSKKNGSLYVGMTNDVNRRLSEHNQGRVPSTRRLIPLDLVYHEALADRRVARLREKYFKSGFGKEHLKALIYGGNK